MDSQKAHYIQVALEAVARQGLANAAQRDLMDEMLDFSQVLQQVVSRYSIQATAPVLAGMTAHTLRKYNPVQAGDW